MIFRLFPKRPDHPLADGQELKRILAELHVARALNAVDEVVGWFESLKHAEDFRLDHLFDVLRQLDDAAQPHLRRLARDYLHSPHLSTVERQRLWTRSCTYLSEVATVYSLCIERARLDPKGRGSVAFKVSLPLLNTRLQAACCARLKWLAYRYEPPGEELWRCLGETYLAAEAAGHAQKSLQLYPAQLGLSSVAQQYLHALVFFTSSVDGLMPLQVEMADRLIAHFLSGFVFSADCRPDSVYWVDAASGGAPARLARKASREQPRPAFLFGRPGADRSRRTDPCRRTRRSADHTEPRRRVLAEGAAAGTASSAPLLGTAATTTATPAASPDHQHRRPAGVRAQLRGVLRRRATPDTGSRRTERDPRRRQPRGVPRLFRRRGW
jgi:hypothetical protein